MNTSSLENSSNLELITASELRDVIRKAADPNHDAAVLASQYLDALRARPALCATKCLELFHECLKDKTRFHEQDLNVVFYILNSFQICLRKLENADVDEKVFNSIRFGIREAAFAYIQNVCEVTQNRGYYLPTFIRTKIAVVIVQCLRMDYPQHWPNVFDQIRSLSPILTNTSQSRHSKMLKDLFLRICEAISEEIVVFRPDRSKIEIDHNNVIKDAMKSNQNKILIEVMSSMLSTIQESRKIHDDEVVSHGLKVMKRYLGWIEWDTIFSVLRDILPLIVAGLNESSCVALQCCDCLLEILDRSEDDRERKIRMCREINLFPVIGSINMDDDIDLAIKISEVVAATGIELLNCLDSFPEEEATELSSRTDSVSFLSIVVSQLELMLNMFWVCFAYDDIDVTGAILPFAMRLTGTLQKQRTSSIDDISAFPVFKHFPQLIAIMYKQMQYPADFKFDYLCEDDAEEQMFRANLMKLYKKIVKVLPDESLQFLCAALSNISMPLSSAPISELEASLRLVFHYCEGLSSSKSIASFCEEGPFHQVIVALHQSDVAHHCHREILILYYEVVIRYVQVLKLKPDLLTNVLTCLSGTQGIQHAHERVRSRACYLLLRLVKEIGVVLRPYVETAITGIQGLLSDQRSQILQADDYLNLFETMGLLIGKTELSPAVQKQYLIAVISPHIRSMEELILSKNLEHDPDHFGNIMANLIASIAHVSKGFAKPQSDVVIVLTGTIPVLLASLKALPSNENIRVKTIITLHRLIICIGRDILPQMGQFLSILISHCDNKDILDVTQLLNQLCTKFKSAAAPALDANVIPFLQKCHQLMPSEEEFGKLAPHLQVEQMSTKKLSFTFLQHIVSKKVTSTLLSSKNVDNLENILQAMKNGAITICDPSINKTCISFFCGLVNQWCDISSDVDCQIRHGFVSFSCEVVTKELLLMVLSKNFDEKDALQSRIIYEIGKFLFLLKSKIGSEFNGVMNRHLSSLRCSENLTNSFSISKNAREMENCLKNMIKTIKNKS